MGLIGEVVVVVVECLGFVYSIAHTCRTLFSNGINWPFVLLTVAQSSQYSWQIAQPHARLLLKRLLWSTLLEVFPIALFDSLRRLLIF